ncbi:transposase [Streptomyces sp. NPDC102437]|uniref:IS701 family transposase n=1 Tax=Streptomyces sp. NPDC102437 TaxID=3366175 RepID=UPI0038161B83
MSGHRTAAAPVQRPPAEVRYAEELAALRAGDRDPRPPGWELSLRAARRFVIGDPDAGISRKFVGNPSLVDRALVTLATSRGLMLVGEPGTAKSLLSELIAAAVSGDSTLTVQGGAATTAFRLGLEERGLEYVVGISTTTTAQPEDAQPCTPAYTGRGRRPVPAYPEPAQQVKSLVIAAGKNTARPVQWREGSRPGSGRSGHERMYSRFVALRIRPAGREIRKATAATGLPVRWLLAEWPADQDEPVQFWLSNLPATTPLPVLVRTAKLRWRIENDYREMKQALGLAHFEGRTWPGWHHHVTLVSVAHAFCTLQRLSRSPKETASA